VAGQIAHPRHVPLPARPIRRRAGEFIFSEIRLDVFPKSEIFSTPSRAHQRGASRSSRTWSAGCGGRVGSQRAFRARTNDPDADAKACGPGLPTLRSSCAVTSRVMTGARKPGLRGERAISVKTIAQGMPDDPAEPVVTAASFSYCWRATGEAVAGIPCALFDFGGQRTRNNSGLPRRENADMCL
jgi:hypothetical protein